MVGDEVTPRLWWRGCLLSDMTQDGESQVEVEGQIKAPRWNRKLHFRDHFQNLFFGGRRPTIVYIGTQISGQSGRVAHELPEGGLVTVVRVDDREIGQEFRDGVVQAEDSALTQHHGPHGCEHLGYGSDPEGRVDGARREDGGVAMDDGNRIHLRAVGVERGRQLRLELRNVLLGVTYNYTHGSSSALL